MRDLILAVEPTSSATRLALFRGDRPIATHTARHPGREDSRERPADQVSWRAWAARTFLDEAGVQRKELGAVAAAGGLLRPVEGGTYVVDEAMLRDCQRSERGYHPANVGALVAKEIASEHVCPAFVVDPLSVDELEPVARLETADELTHRKFANALAIRGVARRHARAVERPLEQLKLVVARLGIDPCLSALREGRLVDVVVPAEDRLIAKLGVHDVGEAEDRAERGDGKAMVVLEAMAYGVAKSIGALAAGLGGELDAILITGRGAQATGLVNGVCRRVEWIAPVFVYLGDDDLLALAQGAWRVLMGEEQAKSYG